MRKNEKKKPPEHETIEDEIGGIAVWPLDVFWLLVVLSQPFLYYVALLVALCSYCYGGSGFICACYVGPTCFEL